MLTKLCRQTRKPNLADAYNQAATAATLTGEQIAAVETGYSDWQSAANADALAADAASKAQAALDAAANKKPVSIEHGQPSNFSGQD